MKRRFAIAFSLLFVLFTTGICTSIYYHWQSSTELRQVITGHQLEQLRNIFSQRLHRTQLDLQVSETVFANNLDGIVENVQALESSIQGCLDCHHELPLQQALEEIDAQVESYKTQYSTYITAMMNRQRRQELQLEAASTAADIGLRIDSLMLQTSPALEERSSRAVVGVDRSWRVLAVTLVVTFVAALLVAALLVRSVTSPVGRLVSGTARIADGELGFQIEHSERHELGALIDSFNEMSTALEVDQQRLDGYVARLRRLIRSVFALRASHDPGSLQTQLTLAMEELVEAEVYGAILKADLAKVFVLSLRRAGQQEPFCRVAVSSTKLKEIQSGGSPKAWIGLESEGEEWPFEEPSSALAVRNFVISWIEAEGNLRGALIAANKRAGEFVDDDAAVLSALGRGVAEAIDNIQLFQELKIELEALQGTRS